MLQPTLPASRRSAAEGLSPSRERGRKRIVALATVFYLLLIFEGTLRKWALPSHGEILFFIRDPFALAIYALAIRHSFFPARQPLLLTGMAFAVLGALMILVQALGVAATIAHWPILAAYGWRNYFLYIPLPFVLGETLRRADIERLVKITLLLSVPVAILVFLQFRAAPYAPINVGFATNVAEQFRGLTVDAEHTRPMGLFTSDVGQKEFTVSCLAMILSLWILPAARRYVRTWQLIVATCAVLTCLAVGESRGAMVHSGIIVIAALVSGLVIRRARVSARAILLPGALAAIAIVLYPVVFPGGYDAFVNRWNRAAVAESVATRFGIFGRALYGFVDFFNLMGTTPVMGYGLGLAGNASLILGVTIPGFHGWAETDWARHIVDLGPIVGVAFILYRAVLVAWLGRVCLAGARAAADPLPILWFAFVGVDLLYGQLTGHGTVNGYCWLFTGLCLAAARADEKSRARSESAAVTSPATQPFPNLLR
jgi:hypothetical protein